jgi:hypothetical protein
MLIQIIHWIVYCYYLYLFGYASLFKILQRANMMEGMNALGFNKIWTLAIGYGELLGVVGLLLGIWWHEAKNASVIYLFCFSLGALMVHFAHHDYKDFYDALFGCIAAVILLTTDKFFSIQL